MQPNTSQHPWCKYVCVYVCVRVHRTVLISSPDLDSGLDFCMLNLDLSQDLYLRSECVRAILSHFQAILDQFLHALRQLFFKFHICWYFWIHFEQK